MGVAVSAFAQHADDNPILTAEDAFGLTLGTESIGIYSVGSVRGFSPIAAGNVRVDGMYFDQQGTLSNRVIEDAAIRVGISAFGYAFPAPTGIVDYRLRNSESADPVATLIIDAGPFATRSVSIDGDLPVASGHIHVPMGASYQVSSLTLGGPYPGYTSRILNFGASPKLAMSDRIVLRAFVDWQRISQQQTMPIVLTAGDYLPPEIPHRYLGQNWAEGESLSENFGLTTHAQISKYWSLAVGLFRSIADNPVSYADIYANTLPNGLADHLLAANPNQRSQSTSGEVRLTGRIQKGPTTHELVFVFRGRDTKSLYGGGDTVDVGREVIDGGEQILRPHFNFSTRVDDRSSLSDIGVGYIAKWSEHAEFSAGIQREEYEKTVTQPQSVPLKLVDVPWRTYAAVALPLTRSVAAYGGYTQGLEDSGVAPDDAANRGAILPAARTWQVDVGALYKPWPKIKIIAGAFEITKPYFNLDAIGVDRALGVQRAKDLEFSVSGEAFQNLSLVAGAVVGRVEVIGSNLAQQGVGPTAFGQPHVWATLNANYTLSGWPASFDVGMTYFGPAPSSVDNGVYAPSVTQESCGARYKFSVHGSPATLRLQVQNIADVHVWNIGGSPGYMQWNPRSFTAYMTVDL